MFFVIPETLTSININCDYEGLSDIAICIWYHLVNLSIGVVKSGWGWHRALTSVISGCSRTQILQPPWRKLVHNVADISPHSALLPSPSWWPFLLPVGLLAARALLTSKLSHCFPVTSNQKRFPGWTLKGEHIANGTSSQRSFLQETAHVLLPLSGEFQAENVPLISLGLCSVCLYPCGNFVLSLKYFLNILLAG